jgi:hypothetical protein
VIIKFWDKTQIEVTDKQWAGIKRLRDNGTTWIELKNPKIEFNPTAIASAHPSINLAPTTTQKYLSVADLTDEQRERNRKKIAQLKKTYLHRITTRKG